jgi:Fe-S oxidoreductase
VEHTTKCFGEKRLSKFLEYVPIYEGDRYCLMCGQACPVRRVTKNEATSPHGWALLVASVQRGMLQWNAESVDVLYHCADCGNCQGNCATDRPLPYAIQAARDEVVRLGHVPASVKAMDEKLRVWGNPYRQQIADDRQQTVISDQSAVLFVGDAAHFLKPEIISAAEKLLNAIDVHTTRFAVGHSSGYLPYILGLWETARSFARNITRDLESMRATRVITLSTQDAHALKHVYAELGVALPDAVNVSTLAEVLVNAGDKLKISSRAPQAYTYHDASQAIRLKNHWLNTRVLATQAMGVEPREMLFRENLATPIGTSGGLQYTQPALAENLARTRIAEAKATGAEIILTDDPLDSATLEKYADGMTVMNLYAVLAEQLQ